MSAPLGTLVFWSVDTGF